MSTGNCGNDCRCASGSIDTRVEELSLSNKKPLQGKSVLCPCSKEEEDCCHKEEFAKEGTPNALDELCGPHNGKLSCSPDEDKKPAV